MIRSLVAASLLALNPPAPIPTDFQVCVPIHNAPLFPQRHINGTAPVADIV